MPQEVRYLLSCASDLDREALTEDLLSDVDAALVIDSATDLDLVVNYTRVKNDQILIGISCHIWIDDDTVADVIVDVINQAIADHDTVNHVVKLRDSRVLAQNRVVAEEIYAVESDLREALSMAFLNSEVVGSNYYEILAASNVRTAPDMPGPSDLQAQMLNEFSFISFSDYRHVANRRAPSKVGDLVHVIEQSADFASLQAELAPRVQLDSAAVAFLASLQDILAPLEAARNAVMHSRPIPERVKQNYVRAIAQAREAISLYLRQFE